MGRTSNIIKLDAGFSRKPGDTGGYPIVCYDGRRPFDVHAAYWCRRLLSGWFCCNKWHSNHSMCKSAIYIDLFGRSNPCFTVIFSTILKSTAERSQWHSCFYPKVGTIFMVIWNYPILSIHGSGAVFLSHTQLSCWRVICMRIARGMGMCQIQWVYGMHQSMPRLREIP